MRGSVGQLAQCQRGGACLVAVGRAERAHHSVLSCGGRPPRFECSLADEGVGAARECVKGRRRRDTGKEQVWRAR